MVCIVLAMPIVLQLYTWLAGRYSFGTIVSHNEVWNTTWVAISVGYGARLVRFYYNRSIIVYSACACCC